MARGLVPLDIFSMVKYVNIGDRSTNNVKQINGAIRPFI
jgi:hypothetical protein